MIRKALTYLTILAITALPVQLISANAESVSMQMAMSQSMMASDECLHDMNTQSEKSHCADQSHECKSCNNCPQGVSAPLYSPFIKMEISLLKTTKFSISHSVLYGIPQKKFLRPPKS